MTCWAIKIKKITLSAGENVCSLLEITYGETSLFIQRNTIVCVRVSFLQCGTGD